MSSPNRSDQLTTVCELIHEEHRGDARHVLVGVRLFQQEVEIAMWPVPEGAGDPLGSLIGFVAPDDWDLFGLSGRVDSRAERFTVLVDRAGAASGIAEPDGRGPEPMLAPEGPMIDLLRRCLLVPTADPEFGVAAWIDATWLDEIARAALSGGCSLDWPALVALHPFADEAGPDATVDSVRSATLEFAAGIGWNRLRRGWAGVGGRVRPPGGRILAESEWFDDGSFARWHLCCVPRRSTRLIDLAVMLPADLLALVVGSLSEEVG